MNRNKKTRVYIYIGHPKVRRRSHCNKPGRLIRLPDSLAKLKRHCSQRFGFDAKDALVTNEKGVEIDYVEVIRDNNNLYIQWYQFVKKNLLKSSIFELFLNCLNICKAVQLDMTCKNLKV
ncbi:hypothetical protein R3W88_000779 [Solanum pinnatisectum]|uniref:KHA domain-containing protein n=1 Tax=Solanum pinnatisectum TaxID=50273 RepID=A0AAV9MK28_9SOLN|nr:hypothetical protein R3W88_000779 [Solanum pinnatisectum]